MTSAYFIWRMWGFILRFVACLRNVILMPRYIFVHIHIIICIIYLDNPSASLPGVQC